MYDSRIGWWRTMVKPPDSLFLLDSYGALQNSSRVLSFNQKVHFGEVLESSSSFELFSMGAAIDLWTGTLLSYDYIFKVTGKYVIPGLLPWVHANNPRTDMVLQRFGDANTEVLGLHTRCMRRVVSQLTRLNRKKCCIENALLQIKHHYVLTKMPPLYVPLRFKIKRGDGNILPFL